MLGTVATGSGRQPAAFDGPMSTVALAGDIILGDVVNAVAANVGHDLLGELTVLQNADLAIANLESVASSGGTRAEKQGLAPYYFRARPETLGVLSAAGIDAVSTANNHSGDFGDGALMEQGALLDEMAIAHVGSGPTVGAACQPAYLDAGSGLVVALFGADATAATFAATKDDPGTCHLDGGDIGAWDATFADSIAEARERAHAVIFAVHWGDDWVAEPSNDKRTLGRRLIDLGVDIVLGSNAHELQGLERHGDGVILHDLAHVLAPFGQPTESAIVTLDVTREGVIGLQVHPVLVEANGSGAHPATGDEATRVLSLLTERSASLDTHLSGDRMALVPSKGEANVRPASIRPASRAPVAPRSAMAPPPGCAVDAVPPDARIEPVSVGPLTLIGVETIRGHYLLPTLVEVDFYWVVEEPVAADLTIVPHGARDGTEIDLWLSEHEPCDWGWPTSRWEVGQVYRDRAALRPPPEALSVPGAASVVSGTGTPLEISVGVRSDGEEIARSRTLAQVEIGAPAVALIVGAGALFATLATAVMVVRRRRQTRGTRRGHPSS